MLQRELQIIQKYVHDYFLPISLDDRTYDYYQDNYKWRYTDTDNPKFMAIKFSEWKKLSQDTAIEQKWVRDNQKKNELISTPKKEEKEGKLDNQNHFLKVKCNFRLLHHCNQSVLGLEGQKLHLHKVLAYYCYMKSMMQSGHLHNISKINPRFKTLKKFCHNNTFYKYNRLMIQYGFATPDGAGGLLLKNMQKVTDELCGVTDGKEKIFRIYDKNNELNLKGFQEEFEKKLIKDKFDNILYTAKSAWVTSKGNKGKVENIKFKKSLETFETTPLKMSNKTIAGLFNKTASYAKKAKKIMTSGINLLGIKLTFVSQIINWKEVNRMFHEDKEKFKSLFHNKNMNELVPSFYLNKSTAYLNLGQKLIYLKD